MKPKVICHMMSTVDGRLLAERWSEPFDGTDKDEMYTPYFEVRKELNATHSLVGRNTIQKDFNVGNFNYADYAPALEYKPFIGKTGWEHTFVVFDSKGKCLFEEDNLEGSGIITVLGESVSEGYLSLLREKGISYIFSGYDGKDLVKALETLNKDFGIDTLLLEGGGILNGAFLNAGLIDELSLLMYPGIDGLSGMPAIFDYPGKKEELPARKQALEFKRVEVLTNGVAWLRYKFHKT